MIGVKKTTAWGESGFPARLLDVRFPGLGEDSLALGVVQAEGEAQVLEVEGVAAGGDGGQPGLHGRAVPGGTFEVVQRLGVDAVVLEGELLLPV